METVKATTKDVVCTLTAAEQRARGDELRVTVARLIVSARETPRGYVLGFAPAARETVREFVAFERECCSFMTYTIDDGDGTGLRLELSGPAGTKELLREWLPERVLSPSPS